MPKKNETKCVFETADVMNNYIFLSEDTWENHIVAKRLFMAGEHKKVKKTVEDPAYIYEDKTFSTTRNYYSVIRSIRLKYEGVYLKVSVGVDNGNVKSAYPVDDMDSEGKLIYKKI